MRRTAFAISGAAMIAAMPFAWFRVHGVDTGLFVSTHGATAWEALRFAALVACFATLGACIVGVAMRRPPRSLAIACALALLELTGHGVFASLEHAQPAPAYWVAVAASLLALVVAAREAPQVAQHANPALVWCSTCGGAAHWVPSHNRVWCQHCALSRNRHLQARESVPPTPASQPPRASASLDRSAAVTVRA